MGIRHEWADSNEIILTIYVEFPWTWTEYLEKVEPLLATIKTKATPCATVIDVSKMQSIPKDGNMLQILLYVDKVMPANVFASTMVGANPIVMTFMNLVTKLRPNAKRLVSFTRTLDEAYSSIYKRYISQYPDLPTPKYQSKES